MIFELGLKRISVCPREVKRAQGIAAKEWVGVSGAEAGARWGVPMSPTSGRKPWRLLAEPDAAELGTGLPAQTAEQRQLDGQSPALLVKDEPGCELCCRASSPTSPPTSTSLPERQPEESRCSPAQPPPDGLQLPVDKAHFSPSLQGPAWPRCLSAGPRCLGTQGQP